MKQVLTTLDEIVTIDKIRFGDWIGVVCPELGKLVSQYTLDALGGPESMLFRDPVEVVMLELGSRSGLDGDVSLRQHLKLTKFKAIYVFDTAEELLKWAVTQE